jgi:MFS family permease
MRPPPYDRGQFHPPTWLPRLRRAARVVRDLIHSVWFVAFGMLSGGVAGALIGALWDTSFSFWAGMIVGAVVGGTAGGACAKHLFFSRTEPEVEPMPIEPTPGAPRWPGVEERFQKILVRLRILFVLLIVPFLLLCYLNVADDLHWPVPSSKLRVVLIWGAPGVMILAGILMMVLIRCPKCGAILWKAAQLYECPHCGIVLRD